MVIGGIGIVAATMLIDESLMILTRLPGIFSTQKQHVFEEVRHAFAICRIGPLPTPTSIAAAALSVLGSLINSTSRPLSSVTAR